MSPLPDCVLFVLYCLYYGYWCILVCVCFFVFFVFVFLFFCIYVSSFRILWMASIVNLRVFWQPGSVTIGVELP